MIDSFWRCGGIRVTKERRRNPKFRKAERLEELASSSELTVRCKRMRKERRWRLPFLHNIDDNHKLEITTRKHFYEDIKVHTTLRRTKNQY